MNHRKHGLRLSGLLAVVALGVMAFAGSAQALTPTFLVGGVSGTTLPATIGAKQVGTGTMLVPGLNFQLSCKEFSVEKGDIVSGSDAKSVLLYKGCTTLDVKTLAESPCEVVEPIKAEALLLPAETTDGKFAILAEKIKALVKLILVGTLPAPKPCILPEDNTVTGEVCFKITDATNDTVAPLIEAPATCKNRSTLEGLNNEVTTGGFPDLVKYGAQPVTLDGKAVLSLIEGHNGLTLGVSLF